MNGVKHQATMSYLFVIGFFVTLVLLLMTPQKTYAQFSLFDATAGLDISLLANPENPTPFSEIRFTLESFNVDLDRLPITWLVNGQQINSGVGVTQINITVGDIGSRTDVEARVRLTSGEIVTKRFVVSPGSVDILWEAIDSYTPPFYKGKALPSRQSRIKFVALPQVRSGESLISPKQFKYTWERDFSVIDTESGFGKDAMTIQNGIVSKKETVSVKAVSQDGSNTAVSQVTVPMFEPEIVGYIKRIGLGKSKTAITSATISSGQDIVVLAEPFFFSTEENHVGNLSYTWRAQGQQLRGAEGKILKTELPLQNPGESGSVTISLDVDHVDLPFQTASTSFSLIFNN